MNIPSCLAKVTSGQLTLGCPSCLMTLYFLLASLLSGYPLSTHTHWLLGGFWWRHKASPDPHSSLLLPFPTCLHMTRVPKPQAIAQSNSCDVGKCQKSLSLGCHAHSPIPLGSPAFPHHGSLQFLSVHQVPGPLPLLIISSSQPYEAE